MNNYQEILKSVGYPTEVLIIDFESYYDSDFSLSKMSTIEYICDPQFDFTGMGYGFGDRIYFIPKPDLKQCVEGLQLYYGNNLEQVTVIAKNCKFDIAILAVKFGIIPPFVIDIDDLLRHYDARMSHRMKDVTSMFGLKPKGKTVKFKGLHYEDMDDETKAALAEYCINDVEIESSLFSILIPLMSNPVVEIPVARHTLDLYLRPRFAFDFDKAKKLKATMTLTLMEIAQRTGYDKKWLSSNLDFVKILQEALPDGEHVPTKPGKPGRNMTKLLGKPRVIPAFAKDDVGFQELLVHPDETVRNLCMARQAVKSWPLHIKRINNMANQAETSDGLLRVPLNYYGAHTGRWSGGEKINLQNLGGRGRAGAGTHPLIQHMRSLLGCPDGSVLGIADSAQIEARILAWFANQEDLVNGFAAGDDIYSVFATELFQCVVRKAAESDPPMIQKFLKIKRGFGKDAILGCLAFGTPILTNHGWKPIEEVILGDKLWDGRNWVLHNGVCFRGKKSCVNVKGIWATPDHEIFDKGVWFPAISLNTSNQKLEIDTENLKLLRLNLGHATVLSPSNVVAPVVESLLRTETIWSQENLHAVMSVLKRHPVKLRLITRGLQNHTVQDFLIEFVQLLVDVNLNHINIMVKEVLECGPLGSLIESLFLNTWQNYQDGIIQDLMLTESTITKDMNRVISDSPPGSKILETADILYSGDYHRFQAGNMIMSNCGYGMGTNKFFTNCIANLDLRPMFDSGEYDWDFINHLIKTYRTTYNKIPEFWTAVEKAFKWVIKHPHEQTQVSRKYDENGTAVGFRLAFLNKKGTVHIVLPSGRHLTYRHCAMKRTTKGSEIRWHHGHLWGGSITENIVQAVARDLLAFWILCMDDADFAIVLHSHDEIVTMLRKNDVHGLDDMLNIMHKGPEWATGLPLDAEGSLTEVYKK